MSKIKVTKIINSVVIRQEEGVGFFLAAPNTFAISVPNLAFLLKFLVQNGYISKKVLEGILAEIEE